MKWARIIDQQHGSGLPVSVFCRQRSLPASTYYGWRRKLSVGQSGPGFVEAKMVEEGGGDPKPAGLAPEVNAGDVRIELAGNRRVIVTRGFDRQLLLEVICVLEEMAGVGGVG